MACLVCHGKDVTEHLDMGSHPVSSFYLVDRDAKERNFRLALGQCDTCGTIQSTNIVPHEALVPPYDWLFAREPEDHLDVVVEQLIETSGIGPDSVIAALTAKDDTTLERFRKKGFRNTWRVDLQEDLGVTNPAASYETAQKFNTPERMSAIAAKRGSADIFIVRHIMEHAEDLHAFIRGLSAAVKPGGIVMIEVPDCTANLQLADFCMVWEEHSLYLTPETFRPLSTIGGFEEIRTEIYPLPFENCLVHFARKTREPGPVRISDEALAQRGMLETYANQFGPMRAKARSELERIRRDVGPIALFGAGHLACAFANFLDLSDLIEFVADDTPQKQNKFLPGSRLPIVSSTELVDQNIKMCLLALSISNEDAVIKRQQGYVDSGGHFRSIFQASPRSLLNSSQV
ncbi:MAG: methyltransferase domain-containing protein [Pseudomonadota bacterium]